MTNPIETPSTYNKYVDKKSPNSPILKNCFNAFWVGGLICSIGQIIFDFCKYQGLETASANTVVLIGIAAFLTGLNIFNKIGKFAGARFFNSYYRFCEFYCFTCYRV